nr:PRC-barrel domain-containing protein [Brachybacterium sp. Marseille-Q7125]
MRPADLEGVTVHGADGVVVGRVRDIYLRDATGEFAALAVIRRQLSSRTVLLPATVIAALPREPDRERAEPDGLHLSIPAAIARGGPCPPATGHVGAAELRELEQWYARAARPDGATHAAS